jgi:hypothetical protein
MSETAVNLFGKLKLVHQAEGVTRIQPWAWYTPESLVSSGGEIDSWGDVTGGGRDLVPTFAGCSMKKADLGTDVIDGHDVFVSPTRDVGCNFNMDYYAETVGTTTFNGHTMFVVANPVSDPPDSNSAHQIFVDLVHNMVLRGVSGSAQQFVGYGSLEGTDTRGLGPFAIAAWATADGSAEGLGIEINNSPWQADPSDADYWKDPWGSDWSHTTSSFADDVIVLPANVPGAWIAEIIVFTEALDASQRAEWWSYLQSKYPSLGW